MKWIIHIHIFYTYTIGGFNQATLWSNVRFGCVIQKYVFPAGLTKELPHNGKSRNVWTLLIVKMCSPFPHANSMQKNTRNVCKHVPDHFEGPRRRKTGFRDPLPENGVKCCLLMSIIDVFSLRYDRLLFGCVFRKCIFLERRSKEFPQMGLPGGQHLSEPPTTLSPYIEKKKQTTSMKRKQFRTMKCFLWYIYIYIYIYLFHR